MGSVTLPSGKHIVLPLKVWRTRLHANDQAYVPDVLLSVNMRDDRAVQAATLAVLRKQASGYQGRNPLLTPMRNGL